MKSYLILGTGLCLAMMLGSCKSSESAYKKAYEKAKQQELAQPQVSEPVEVAPVVSTPVVTNTPTTTTTTTTPANVSIREEKVTMVNGNGLKAYGVVCGSFASQSNAEALKTWLDKEGYSAVIVKNEERNMYRVVVESYDDKIQAAQARDAFKAKYPSRADFQGAWLLYRIY